jgi:hypothetical protein
MLTVRRAVSHGAQGLAKVNPGYDVHGHKWSMHPPLGSPPSWGLADHIVKQRLFVRPLPLDPAPSEQPSSSSLRPYYLH